MRTSLTLFRVVRRSILTPRMALALWTTTALLALPCGAQPVAQWVRSGLSDVPGAIAVSPAGNLNVSSFSNLVSFGLDGVVVASNGLGSLALSKFVFDEIGNRYLVGSRSVTNTKGATVSLFVVAKRDPDDKPIWERIWDEPDAPPTYGKAIAVDRQGNVIAGGEIRHADWGQYYPGNGDGFFVRKYDGNGQVLWTHQIAHANSGQYFQAYLEDLGVGTNGQVVFCGYLSPGATDFGGQTVYPDSTGHGYNGDFFLAALHSNGNLDWAQLGYAVALATSPDGEIYAAFDWAVDGQNGLAKFNSQGGLLWSKVFSGIYMARSQGALTLSLKGEVVFTGQLYAAATFGSVILHPINTNNEDFFVAATDTQGNVRWALSGGSSAWDNGLNVASDRQGNVYLTGFTQASGAFDGLPLTASSGTGFISKILTAFPLKATRGNGTILLTWPVRATNYVLEAMTSLSGVSWTTVTNTPTVSATNKSIQLPLTGPANFFRLRKL